MTAPQRQTGQATVAAALLLLVLLLVAAGLTDTYLLLETRAWAQRAAEDAAVIGASAGRDWDGFVASGQMSLDADQAHARASQALQSALAGRSLAASSADIRVLPEPGGGTLAGFPPLARADLFGASGWSSDEPAVGVYLALPVETIFLRWLNNGQPVELHVFAAAGVVASID